jgi:hypothetical protein
LALPAIDLGLMAEHLATHEGVINKLEHYYTEVQHPHLKQIIHQQIMVMRTHVHVMLMLLRPNQEDFIHLPAIENHSVLPFHHEEHRHMIIQDKDIALEARATANFMANNNFMSALMMKKENDKHAHIEMALQQETLEKRYGEFIKKMDWEYTPMASVQEQLETIKHYQYLMYE